MFNIINTSFLAFCVSSLMFFSLSGQNGIGTFGNTYIHSNSEIGIHSKLYFNSGKGESPGIIITNRNADSPGMISFMKSSDWENAANDRHVDGYCKIYSEDTFTFPIGNLGHYKPLTIEGAYGTSAAYVYANAVTLHDVEPLAISDNDQLGSVSEAEYWILNGDNETRFTLHWNESSNINELVDGNIENLRIVGWNGTSWEVIPSLVLNDSEFVSDMSEGSIQTDNAIIPDAYEAITFGSVISSPQADSEFGSVFNGEQIDLTVFPNPTLSLANLNLDYKISGMKDGALLVVIDGAGQLVYKQELENEKDLIQLPYIDNTPGNFQIGIITDNNSKAFRTVIVSPE